MRIRISTIPQGIIYQYAKLPKFLICFYTMFRFDTLSFLVYNVLTSNQTLSRPPVLYTQHHTTTNMDEKNTIFESCLTYCVCYLFVLVWCWVSTSLLTVTMLTSSVSLWHDLLNRVCCGVSYNVIRAFLWHPTFSLNENPTTCTVYFIDIYTILFFNRSSTFRLKVQL